MSHHSTALTINLYLNFAEAFPARNLFRRRFVPASWASGTTDFAHAHARAQDLARALVMALTNDVPRLLMVAYILDLLQPEAPPRSSNQSPAPELKLPVAQIPHIPQAEACLESALQIAMGMEVAVVPNQEAVL